MPPQNRWFFSTCFVNTLEAPLISWDQLTFSVLFTWNTSRQRQKSSVLSRCFSMPRLVVSRRLTFFCTFGVGGILWGALEPISGNSGHDARKYCEGSFHFIFYYNFLKCLLNPQRRRVTSLGHQGREEFSEVGPNFLNYVQWFQTMSNSFFKGGW